MLPAFALMFMLHKPIDFLMLIGTVEDLPAETTALVGFFLAQNAMFHRY